MEKPEGGTVMLQPLWGNYRLNRKRCNFLFPTGRRLLLYHPVGGRKSFFLPGNSMANEESYNSANEKPLNFKLQVSSKMDFLQELRPPLYKRMFFVRHLLVLCCRMHIPSCNVCCSQVNPIFAVKIPGLLFQTNKTEY